MNKMIINQSTIRYKVIVENNQWNERHYKKTKKQQQKTGNNTSSLSETIIIEFILKSINIYGHLEFM